MLGKRRRRVERAKPDIELQKHAEPHVEPESKLKNISKEESGQGMKAGLEGTEKKHCREMDIDVSIVVRRKTSKCTILMNWAGISRKKSKITHWTI